MPVHPTMTRSGARGYQSDHSRSGLVGGYVNSRWWTAAALGACIAIFAGGFAARYRWQSPSVVADHQTAPAASLEMKLGGASSLAQWLVPDRDGLAQIDLVLAAETEGLPGVVELTVEELSDRALPEASWPAVLPAPDRRRVVRKSSVAASALPVGSAWRIGPGTPEETWVPVRFEAISASRGRTYLVTLAYPDGTDTAGKRVSTLAKFPNRYVRGELYVNAFQARGTLLLRLAGDESVAAGVRRAVTNLARAMPVYAGSAWLPGTLAVVCGILWVATVLALMGARRKVRGV